MLRFDYRDNVVDVATRDGLDGPCFEDWCGQKFSVLCTRLEQMWRAATLHSL